MNVMFKDLFGEKVLQTQLSSSRALKDASRSDNIVIDES